MPPKLLCSPGRSSGAYYSYLINRYIQTESNIFTVLPRKWFLLLVRRSLPRSYAPPYTIF